LTRTDHVDGSGVLFQSDYIVSPSTSIEIRLILPVQVSASVRLELVRRGTVMPVIPPERLDALGTLTITVSLFGFLRL
jgi:hypothetical protein